MTTGPATENAVRWFEIYVQDMDRARRFYEIVLGIELEKLDAPDGGPEMWSFPMSEKLPGAGGALVRMEGVASSPGGTLVYFGCENCGDEASRVVAAGGRSSAKRCRSARTATSSWRSTARAT